ncbi:MAG: hypothetical protein M1817_002083 [Caeruleum heppii]|nr:MAG: hypothetical protein M1817_002083 [Caeruleum heppii]
MTVLEGVLEFVLEQPYYWPAFLPVIALYLLNAVVNSAVREVRIQALGGHAPQIRHWLPLGIDFIYNSVSSAKRHDTMELWQSWFRSVTAHTAEANVGGDRIVFTEDPENIKALLATQFKDFGKGEPFRRDWHEFLGDSIFTTDLDQWQHSRQLIRPLFIKDRVSDLETFERHVQRFLGKIAGNGAEVDMAGLFFRYTLDAATDFLLGRSVDSLDNPQTAFAEAFNEVQRVQTIIARSGPLGKYVPRGSFRKGLRVIDDFVNPYIDDALRLSPDELEKRTKSDHGYTFLHALAGYTKDRKMLRDQLVAVLLAGRDTTAATLSWTFYELGRNPEIVRRLRQEILERVGPSRTPTYDDLKSMKYLQAVLNETLRLYPAVPYNVRLALHDTTLPTGGGPDGTGPIGILKDTSVGYSTLLMQRRAELYSPPPSSSLSNEKDAPDIFPVSAYEPGRWLAWTPKSWQYIPFNGGPRICIGQQFALTEMGYTIVRVLQRFERVEGRREAREMPMKADIVLQPAKEVFVRLWEVGRS